MNKPDETNKIFLDFKKKNRSHNPNQKTKPRINEQEKRIRHLVGFAVLMDHRLIIKES